MVVSNSDEYFGICTDGTGQKKSQGTSVEDLRENIILSGGLRRKRGELAWNVYFSPQNKALVFRDRNTGDFCIAKHFVVLYNDE